MCEALGNDDDVVFRGGIRIKGKGEMELFFLQYAIG